MQVITSAFLILLPLLHCSGLTSPGESQDETAAGLVAGYLAGAQSASTSTSGSGWVLVGSQTVAGGTYYICPTGLTNTESTCTWAAPSATTAKNLTVRVPQNATDGTVVVTLRKSGAATALSVSVGAAQTGTFKDSDSVAFAADDLFSVEVNATAATAGNITTNISLLMQ